MVELQPKQPINQYDYCTMTQSKVQDIPNHDTYTTSYSAIVQQIRIDAMLSRQIQEEEQKCFEEHIKQLENKRSCEYHLNEMGDQMIPCCPFSR